MLHGVGWHARHIRLTDGSDCRDQDAPASKAPRLASALVTRPLTLTCLGPPGLAT